MNGNRSSFSARSNGHKNGHLVVVQSQGQQVSFTGITNGSGSVDPDQEQTPEQDVNSRARPNGCLSHAPRSKCPGLPILRTKIKPSEALSLERKTEVANSSKFSNCKGGFKRKNADFNLGSAENASKLPKPLSQFVIPESATEFLINNKRKQRSNTCCSSSNGIYPERPSDQNLATVFVSKGIEMKRVEAKVSSIVSSNKPSTSSSGIHRDVTSKGIPNSNYKIKNRNTNIDLNDRAAGAANAGPKVKQKLLTNVAESSNSKKLSKNTTKPVKNTNSKSIPQSPSKDETSKLLSNSAQKDNKEESVPTLLTCNDVESSTDKGLNKNVKIVSELQKQVQQPRQPVELESYKTLKEFLSMPSLPLPDKKIEPEKPKDLYKSRFWEYVDPKKKQNAKSSNCEKQKAYDESAVKSYMEKQKEIRRLKELKEYQERKKELEKKRKQLLALDEKCKNLVKKRPAVTGRQVPTTGGLDELQFRFNNGFKKTGLQSLSPSSALEEFRKSRDLNNAHISAVNEIYKPTQVAQMSGEANKRATLLLKEFETIVKRECISFFTASKNKQHVKAEDKQQVDKAVETTLSLEMQNCSDASILSTTSTIKSYRKNVLGLHSAASKIQAAYRGYQTRKILKEAQIMPGSKQNCILKEDNFFRLCSEDVRQRRRMSFYRTPEKPYDSKSKLKAVRLSAPSGQSFRDSQIQSYIPPPVKSAFSPRGVSSRPQVVSPLGIPSARLNRSFDEPYPKEAIQKLQATLSSPSISARSSKADLLHDINVREFLANATKAENDCHNDAVFNKHRTSETVGAPGPSITDVLLEKLRLYAADKKRNKTLIKPDSYPKGTTGGEGTTGGVGAALEIPYESDFESVSSITKNSDRVIGEGSHDVSITDDYFGPTDSEVRKSSPTPKQRSRSPRHYQQKPRSKSKSPQLDSSLESSTTVDTDADLKQTTDSNKITNSNGPSASAKESPKTQLTSSISTPTVNLYNLPIPALKLRFQAEKEHLNILDKAIEATIAHEKAQVTDSLRKDEIFEMAKAAVDEQMSKLTKLENNSPYTDSMKLAMMCQEQASKTICEFTKWMAEMKKSSMEEQTHNARPDPVDLAVIVYAAVDEAKRIADERRKDRQRNRQQNVEAISGRVRESGSIQPNKIVQQKDQQLQYPSYSERESSISSYQDSFDSGSELETKTDATLESEVEVVSTSVEVKGINSICTNEKETSRAPVLETINHGDTQKQQLLEQDIDMELDVSKKVIDIEDTITDRHEPTSVLISDQVQPNSDTEIPDELSMVVESLNSSSKPINVSTELDEEVTNTEIPEELSLSNEVLDPILSESVECSESIEEESPRNDSAHDEFEHSSSELGHPRYSFAEYIKEKPVGTEDFTADNIVVEIQDKEPLQLEPANIVEERQQVESDIRELEGLHSPIIDSLNDVELQEKSQPPNSHYPSSEFLSDASRDTLTHNEGFLVVEEIAKTEIEPALRDKDDDDDENKEKGPPDKIQRKDQLLQYPSSSDRESSIYSYQDSFDSGSELDTKIDTTLESEVEVVSTSVEVKVIKTICTDKKETNVAPEASVLETINQGDTQKHQLLAPDIGLPVSKKVIDHIEDRITDLHESALRSDQVQPSLDTDISDEQPVVVESLNSSSKPINVSTELDEEVTNTEIPEELSLSNKVLDPILSESVNYSQDHISNLNNSIEEESPINDSVHDEINHSCSEMVHPRSLNAEYVEEKPISSEDCKADHIVVEMEDKEPLQLEAAKILEERQRVENEIRELEALQNPIIDYLNALELQEKPPPPYSPPPSSESLSYSSRSFFVSIQDDKFRDTVVSRVNRMWDAWSHQEAFPELEETTETEIEPVQPDEDDDEDENREKTQFLAQWANSSFDLLINEVIDEAIRLVLHIDNSPTSFVDLVRRGPMALKAQNIRIPKTKEVLIAAVHNLAIDTIPRLLLPDDTKDHISKRVPIKWTCRPRDLVDEILVEEMLEEEYLWTELWPEELLVTEELSEKIIRDCVREVIRNCEIALHG